VIAVGGAALWIRVGHGKAAGGGSPESAVARARFQEATGVRVIRVAIVGGGGIVDLRYQVIDADRALVVHDEPPILIDEDSGAVVDSLFMGHSHGGVPKAGYAYPLLFVNEAGAIEAGGTVSVVIGEWRVEHVPVQ
jgi:hypothetical protein